MSQLAPLPLHPETTPLRTGTDRLFLSLLQQPRGLQRAIKIYRDVALTQACQACHSLDAWKASPEMTSERQRKLHDDALANGLTDQIDHLVGIALERVIGRQGLTRRFRNRLKLEARRIRDVMERPINVSRFDGELWSDHVCPDCERDPARHDMPFWPTVNYGFVARVQGYRLSIKLIGDTVGLQRHWACIKRIKLEANVRWPSNEDVIRAQKDPLQTLADIQRQSDELRLKVTDYAASRYPILIGSLPAIPPAIHAQWIREWPALNIDITLAVDNFTWRETLLVKQAIERWTPRYPSGKRSVRSTS